MTMQRIDTPSTDRASPARTRGTELWPRSRSPYAKSGPHRTYTPQILKILAEEGVVATLCIVGTEIRASPDLVRAEVAGGHTLCNHTIDTRISRKRAPTSSSARAHQRDPGLGANVRAGDPDWAHPHPVWAWRTRLPRRHAVTRLSTADRVVTAFVHCELMHECA